MAVCVAYVFGGSGSSPDTDLLKIDGLAMLISFLMLMLALLSMTVWRKKLFTISVLKIIANVPGVFGLYYLQENIGLDLGYDLLIKGAYLSLILSSLLLLISVTDKVINRQIN